MNAVVRQRVLLVAEQGVQIDEEMAALPRHSADGIGVKMQVLVVLRRVRQRPAEILLLQRRQKYNARLGRSEGIQQRLQPVNEARQSLRPLERFVRAIADDEYGRLEGEDVIFQMTETVRLRTEAGTGIAENRVAAPAEVAKGDRLVGIAPRQRRLPVPVTLLAFDQGTADEDDAVAVEEGEGVRRRRDRNGLRQAATEEDIQAEMFHGSLRVVSRVAFRRYCDCTQRTGRDNANEVPSEPAASARGIPSLTLFEVALNAR